MDNLRGLLCIRRMDKVPNAWISQFCVGLVRRVWTKKESVRIAKIVYVIVDQWVGHGRDGLIVKDCLRKRCLGVSQAKRME